MPDKVKKTDAEWRAQLSPEVYAVTRKKATERAFTGNYWDCKEPGVYCCVCCESALFSSRTKYDSGSGWPAFTEPVSDTCLEFHCDTSFGMTRTEITCGKCEAHLGHVFDVEHNPGGKWFCVNSAAMILVQEPDESDSSS